MRQSKVAKQMPDNIVRTFRYRVSSWTAAYSPAAACGKMRALKNVESLLSLGGAAAGLSPQSRSGSTGLCVIGVTSALLLVSVAN